MKTKILAAFLVIAMLATALTGCGKKEKSGTQVSSKSSGDGIVIDSTGVDEYADYTVSGDVTVAINSSRPTDYEAMIDAFEQLYPDVNLIIDYYSDSDDAAEYLSSRASTGTLPDVVFDEAGKLPIYIRQGWLYPLNSFVENDPMLNDVPRNILEDYTYNGSLYALPNSVHFNVVLLNTDILDELNLDHPELDWNISDYVSLIKAGTTDKYSGCESLTMWYDSAASSAFTQGLDKWGYSTTAKTFDLKSTMQKGLELIREIRAVPGAEASTLKSNTDASGQNDYAKKFGSSTGNVALNSGRVLMQGRGTYNYASDKETFTYNWEYWPVPQNYSGEMGMHVDNSFMTSACKNTAAAFQFLRFATYGIDGNIARLSMYDEANSGKYALNSLLYYPATTNAVVKAKFESLPDVSRTDIYMWENMKNCYRSDPYKFVPEFNEVHYSYLSDPLYKLTTSGDISSTIAQLQPVANQHIKEAWENFNSELAVVQEEFKASH